MTPLPPAVLLVEIRRERGVLRRLQQLQREQVRPDEKPPAWLVETIANASTRIVELQRQLDDAGAQQP